MKMWWTQEEMNYREEVGCSAAVFFGPMDEYPGNEKYNHRGDNNYDYEWDTKFEEDGEDDGTGKKIPMCGRGEGGYFRVKKIIRIRRRGGG